MSVRDATYLGMSFIRSAYGSPERPGQAAIVCQVHRPNSSASVVARTSSITDTHGVWVEVRHRPAAVGEPAFGALAPTERLHDTSRLMTH